MNRAARIDKWETDIRAIVNDYKLVNHAVDTALKAGCMDPNGPLFEAIWMTFARMLARVDHGSWINWFIYDNDCGKKGFVASHSKEVPSKPIRSARHLARLIVDSEGDTPPTKPTK